jgi:hypothetical protein
LRLCPVREIATRGYISLFYLRGQILLTVQLGRLEELKVEMEEANSEYREALAQAGQLIVSYPLSRANLVQRTCSKSYGVR